MNAKILVVDDEETIRKLLVARFQREGWQVETAVDGQNGVDKAQVQKPTVIVTDIKMPALDGFQMIDALKSKGIECPVIVITGHGEKDCAIEALHKGAFDYLEKPFDMDTIAHVVRRAIDREALRQQNVKLLKSLEEANEKLTQQLEVKTELLEHIDKSDSADQVLMGASEHIKGLKSTIGSISENFRGDRDPVVLITGESGVGKEAVARYMHHKTFQKDKPFVAINCAAFPDNLLESELFGYEKGAFTGAMSRKLGLFELGNGGTLFLDEIGEMDLKMQAKLLRVLQERVIRRLGGTADIKVNPHIIAATNRDLAKCVSEKTFREDLYYRLNTIPLSIAPLRSRTEDIELLAKHFLKKASAGREKKIQGFSIGAIKSMQAYSWPGNVRELQSVVERAVILEKGPMLELSQLRQETLQLARTKHNGDQAEAGSGTATAKLMHFSPQNDASGSQLPTMVSTNAGESEAEAALPQVFEKGLSHIRKEMDENFVRNILMETLTREKGNVSAVARDLKLDRANLLRLLKRFDIEPELFRLKKAG